jgi:hypothetical protein
MSHPEVSSNGHEPDVLDLGAVLSSSRRRTLRLPVDAITRDTLSPYELAAVGRAIGLTPQELQEEFERREQGGWAAVELAQGIAWAIARRIEPDLSWEDARRFALDITGSPPDPTRHTGAIKSRRRGMTSASVGSESPGSGPPSSGA